MNHNILNRITELANEIQSSSMEITGLAAALRGPVQFQPTITMYTVSWATAGNCKMIPFIKTLREWTHWGLYDSKWAWDNRQIPNLPIAVAEVIKIHLEDNGAKGVIIRPVQQN